MTSANSSPPIRAIRSPRLDVSLQHFADALQRSVAGGVSVDVVDLLEVVDVGKNECERRSGRAAAGELLVEGARVAEPGHEIAARVVAKVVDELPVAARVQCRSARRRARTSRA